MKKNIYAFVVLFCLLLSYAPASFGQIDTEGTLPVRGRVIDNDSGNPLEYASITISSTNISTVTNQDGFFSLRIPNSARNYQLKIQHLGYNNFTIPLITLIDKDDNVLRMTTGSIRLDEVPA